MRISIDFGITVTDTLQKTKAGKLEHRMIPAVGHPNARIVKNLFPSLDFSRDIDFVAITGGHHQLIGNVIEKTPVVHVNEVDAIGEGGFNLARLQPSQPALIVSAGSGTACIYAKHGQYRHISGTGVGGGTVLGLSKLLLGTSNPREIEELSSKGKASTTDFLLKDVVSGPIGQLPSNATAVNFGKIATSKHSANREDLAAGIVNLVGQTIARLTTAIAVSLQVSEIVVVGRTPAFSSLRHSLEQATLLQNLRPLFPKHAEYASALGALLQAEKHFAS